MRGGGDVSLTADQYQAARQIQQALDAVAESEQATAAALRDATGLGPAGAIMLPIPSVSTSTDADPWHDTTEHDGAALQVALILMGEGGEAIRPGTAEFDDIAASKIEMYQKLADRPGLEAFTKAFQGSANNWRNYARYEYGEVYIRDTTDTTIAKGYRLDSWDSGSQVVSRYQSQLADHPAAAIAKIREMTTKYEPGDTNITVADTAANRLQLDPTLIGEPLTGIKVLEISVQGQPIPPQVLQAAMENQVTLRDVNGHVYN